MTLTPQQITRLQGRAGEVGAATGQELEFSLSPDQLFGTLSATVDGESNIVAGPVDMDELGVHEVELELDALEHGTRVVILDHERTVRIIDNPDKI